MKDTHVSTQKELSLRHIRLGRLKYMLIFSLAPVFANVQGDFFPADATWLFGLDIVTLMGIAYCVGAGILFGFSSVRKLSSYAKVLAVLTGVVYFSWLILGDSASAIPMAVLFMFLFGGCAAIAAFAFTFALNNSERLLGAGLTSLFFALMELLYGLVDMTFLQGRFYLSILVAVTVGCFMQYHTEDYAHITNKKDSSMRLPIVLTLYFFTAHKILEVFYTYLPGVSSQEALFYNGLFGVLGFLLVFALLKTTHYGVWQMCNLFFIAMLTSYVLHLLTPVSSPAYSLAFLVHGFEQVGFIMSYFLLGSILSRYADFRLFRIIIITVLNAYILLYLLPGFLSARFPQEYLAIAASVSGLIFFVFLLLSPFYAKCVFHPFTTLSFVPANDSGVHDTHGEKEDKLAGFQLTPREREVLYLLLEGSTVNQVAGELQISSNTVKFHTKNLYKKLDISSRSELFANFGDCAPPQKRAGNTIQ